MKMEKLFPVKFTFVVSEHQREVLREIARRADASSGDILRKWIDEAEEELEDEPALSE